LNSAYAKVTQKKPTIPAPQPNVLDQPQGAHPPPADGSNCPHYLRPRRFERYRAMVPDAPERVLRQFELNAEAERTMLTGGLEAQKPTTAAATGWPLLSSSGPYCWRP
jgi:hypothetical protein